MDNLEKFIQENRDQLDPELPKGLWEKIEPQSKKQRLFSKTWMNVASIAAGVLLLVSLGISYFYGNDDNGPVHSEPTVAQKSDEVIKEDVNLGEISPEYAEIEMHYASLVNDRVEELNRLNPDPDLMEEIEELEEEYELLKKELGSGGNDAQIIEAMIDNYRIKLQLLEDILDHLKDINHEDYEEVQI